MTSLAERLFLKDLDKLAAERARESSRANQDAASACVLGSRGGGVRGLLGIYT